MRLTFALIPSPDGVYALTSPQKAERMAFQEYHRVMRICTDLVLRGKRPPDDSQFGGTETESRDARVGEVRRGRPRKLAARRPTKPSAAALGGPTLEALTTREREVLALIASGKTTRDVAQELGIAFKTVAVHRSRLMIKLAAGNIADLTRAAIRMELIKPQLRLRTYPLRTCWPTLQNSLLTLWETGVKT